MNGDPQYQALGAAVIKRAYEDATEPPPPRRSRRRGLKAAVPETPQKARSRMLNDRNRRAMWQRRAARSRCWLRGQSDFGDLEFWCDVAGIDVKVVTARAWSEPWDTKGA